MVSGYENFEKIPEAKSRKSKNPEDRDLDLKILKKSRMENPEIPRIGSFFLGTIPKFLNLRVSLPSGFFQDFLKIPGIFGLSQGFEIFLSLGMFISGIWDFLSLGY